MTTSIDTTAASSAATQVASTSSTTTGTSSDSTSFEAMLSSLLSADDSGQVNEEQLYASLIQERLYTKKGEETASSYQQLLTTAQQELQWENGYTPVEQAATQALQGLVDQGVLTESEAESINAQAFKAAQLDDNSGYLYDSLGSTMAVSLLDLAIQSAQEAIDLYDSGTEDAGSLALGNTTATTSTSSQTGTFNGGDGFLYKPVSESNGNLAILLPSSYEGSVESLDLIDANGEIVETGDSYGTYDDGRPLFRFNEPGSSYPDGITVSLNLTDGTTKEYYIPDSSDRWE